MTGTSLGSGQQRGWREWAPGIEAWCQETVSMRARLVNERLAMETVLRLRGPWFET